MNGSVLIKMKFRRIFSNFSNATSLGNLTLAQEMISSDADVNREDEIGWTPLLKAVWARHISLVNLLVQNGADVNHQLRSGQGWSPLYIG